MHGLALGVSHPGGDMDPEVAMRTIRYNFKREFLKCKTIGTKLVFSVGEKPVPNFQPRVGPLPRSLVPILHGGGEKLSQETKLPGCLRWGVVWLWDALPTFL